MNHIIKGGILIIIIWWGWFNKKNQKYVREHLISTIVSCFFAILLAKILEISFPFRLRPMHEESLNFVLPYKMVLSILEGWSAFPSDHAALFFCLSTGMFFISKKVGVIAIFYTVFFISLPRVYLGMHYPTDIIAGALIGIFVALLFNTSIFIKKIAHPILNWSIKKPEFFYPIFFLITFQILDIFESSRDIVGFLKSILISFISK